MPLHQPQTGNVVCLYFTIIAQSHHKMNDTHRTPELSHLWVTVLSSRHVSIFVSPTLLRLCLRNFCSPTSGYNITSGYNAIMLHIVPQLLEFSAWGDTNQVFNCISVWLFSLTRSLDLSNLLSDIKCPRFETWFVTFTLTRLSNDSIWLIHNEPLPPSFFTLFIEPLFN